MCFSETVNSTIGGALAVQHCFQRNYAALLPEIFNRKAGGLKYQYFTYYHCML